MSDTPETDAAVAASGSDWSPVLRAVAQRLERERDRALMDRSNGDIATMTINHYERLIKERDEARELHINALREREATEKEVDAMLERAQKAERERDEAREALRELWLTADAYIPQIDEEQTTKWHNAMALHTTL
jgi:hypothetical protein